MSIPYFKDAILANLAETWNVAQFISIDPAMRIRFIRINKQFYNTEIIRLTEALQGLLNASRNHMINIRTFHPLSYQSRDFIAGITNVDDAIKHIQCLADKDLFMIVNEAVNPNDGGVSCIVQNNVIEFSPRALPRFVESAISPVVTFDRDFGLDILSRVYDIPRKQLDFPKNLRVEFNIHPEPQGLRQERVTIWEMHEVPDVTIPSTINWPNAFSRFIGDKAFGLLIAEQLGCNVPFTKVYVWDDSSFIFSFGQLTGATEYWMRTCPAVPVPGKYLTQRGYVNPYKMMYEEDPKRNDIASCIAQSEVVAKFSGSLVSSEKGITIEGVRGFGHDFMSGKDAPVSLPRDVVLDVQMAYCVLQETLGPVRMEWVHDGNKVWVVQLHLGETKSYGNIIVPGETEGKVWFHINEGLEKLRDLITKVPKSVAIEVHGNVGLTSHIADILRKADHPSYTV